MRLVSKTSAKMFLSPSKIRRELVEMSVLRYCKEPMSQPTVYFFRRATSSMAKILLLLKSVEFDDDVALQLSVAGLDVGPHLTPESEIGGTDSATLRTSWTCLWLCGSCVTGCTSLFRGSDPAI